MLIRTALLALIFALRAGAAPAWRANLTSPDPGVFALPPPTSIELELSWKGMVRAGVVRIDFAPRDVKKTAAYVVKSTSRSLGPAAVIYPYRSDFWAEIDRATLLPRYFHAVETTSKEAADTTVRHFAKRSESTEIETTLKTGAKKKTSYVFPEAEVFDIFSAMLHVRSQTLAVGDRIELLILPFTTPYLLKVKVDGREVHNGRKAIRLTVGMRKIDRKTLELKAYKKLKADMTLWLADDAERMPLEIRAPAFIGDVRAVRVK